MRMWLIPPKVMCRKHLLGEHVELHMLVGTIRREKSLTGFMSLIETAQIQFRHNEIAAEVNRRGYDHQSPLVYVDRLNFGAVNRDTSFRELQNRCPNCRERILAYLASSTLVTK